MSATGANGDLPPLEVRTDELGDLHLRACRALDQSALGGFWSEGQWAAELVDPRRPCLGLWQRDALVAAACGWLIVDELHITLVAVDPAHRRRGLGRLVLEALLRTCDNYEVTEADVRSLATWNAAKPAETEIPFKPARVVLQDFTGVPCVVDLAAMRANRISVTPLHLDLTHFETRKTLAAALAAPLTAS